ncbi:hypothetical protein ACFE04_002994 [Oxalis oulophora]
MKRLRVLLTGGFNLQLQKMCNVTQNIELTEAKWNNVKGDHHRYIKLKTVTLIGHGAMKDVEIIRYLYFLSRAPLLDKIIIDPCHLLFLGTPEENSYRESSELYLAQTGSVSLD